MRRTKKNGGGGLNGLPAFSPVFKEEVNPLLTRDSGASRPSRSLYNI